MVSINPVNIWNNTSQNLVQGAGAMRSGKLANLALGIDNAAVAGRASANGGDLFQKFANTSTLQNMKGGILGTTSKIPGFSKVLGTAGNLAAYGVSLWNGAAGLTKAAIGTFQGQKDKTQEGLHQAIRGAGQAGGAALGGLGIKAGLGLCMAGQPWLGVPVMIGSGLLGFFGGDAAGSWVGDRVFPTFKDQRQGVVHNPLAFNQGSLNKIATMNNQELSEMFTKGYHRDWIKSA